MNFVFYIIVLRVFLLTLIASECACIFINLNSIRISLMLNALLEVS